MLETVWVVRGFDSARGYIDSTLLNMIDDPVTVGKIALQSFTLVALIENHLRNAFYYGPLLRATSLVVDIDFSNMFECDE